MSMFIEGCDIETFHYQSNFNNLLSIFKNLLHSQKPIKYKSENLKFFKLNTPPPTSPHMFFMIIDVLLIEL